MIPVRYAVRRAKTRTEKQQGKRWVVQAEFPGGRKIALARTRTKPPAVQKLRQQVQQVVSSAANAGAIEVTGGSQSAGVPVWKLQKLSGWSGNGGETIE